MSEVTSQDLKESISRRLARTRVVTRAALAITFGSGFLAGSQAKPEVGYPALATIPAAIAGASIERRRAHRKCRDIVDTFSEFSEGIAKNVTTHLNVDNTGRLVVTQDFDPRAFDLKHNGSVPALSTALTSIAGMAATAPIHAESGNVVPSYLGAASFMSLAVVGICLELASSRSTEDMYLAQIDNLVGHAAGFGS
jgi:hypothetical protein